MLDVNGWRRESHCMKTNCRRLISIFALSLISVFGIPSCHAEGPYRLVKDIQVGGEGGWDYLAIDSAARRLYVTHATKVVVIDLDKDTVVGEIADTPGVHGFALAPALGRGFSSNGKENTASIVELKTLETLMKIPTGENPDAILYEPGQQEVYTFNGRGQSATIFSARNNERIAGALLIRTIALSGKPEFAVADSKAGRVFVNIEDKNEVVVIDTKTHTVAATWPLAPGKEPTGLALDTVHHQLFAGCHNQLLVTLDSVTGKVVGTVLIGQGVDATAFDAGTQFAFASCGDGTVTVAHEDARDKLSVVQTLATERGARTMALDPKTHKIYLASAKFEPASAGQRPKIVPGSFKVLVYAMPAKDSVASIGN